MAKIRPHNLRVSLPRLPQNFAVAPIYLLVKVVIFAAINQATALRIENEKLKINILYPNDARNQHECSF